jgi:MoxR-like ATPase
VSDVYPDSVENDSIGDTSHVYVYTKPEIRLALHVATATGRPLLVGGPTGCGKSSLARHAATERGWRYYEKTITSMIQARDLLWEVDHLRRLNDANAMILNSDYTPYIRPGLLWWAMNRTTAAEQAATFGPACKDPNLGHDHPRAVVLLDEIDKADPDVPNNLLVPLGSFHFQVEENGASVALDRAHPPLIIITTNGERELPAAFLRRCIELRIESPEREPLLDIAQAHFPGTKREDLDALLTAIESARPANWPTAALPSPAEFIDNIRAAKRLPGQSASDIAALIVWKQSQAGKVVG